MSPTSISYQKFQSKFVSFIDATLLVIYLGPYIYRSYVYLEPIINSKLLKLIIPM